MTLRELYKYSSYEYYILLESMINEGRKQQNIITENDNF